MKRGAVLLCGGESQRMGTAKAWLPFRQALDAAGLTPEASCTADAERVSA